MINLVYKNVLSKLMPFLPLFLHIQRPRIIGGDTGFELGFLPQKSGVYQRAATSPNKKKPYIFLCYDMI